MPYNPGRGPQKISSVDPRAGRAPLTQRTRDGSISLAWIEHNWDRAEWSAAPVYWREAVGWAASYKGPYPPRLGGTEEQDLAAINETRRKEFLPPFTILTQQRVIPALPHPNFGSHYQGEAFGALPKPSQPRRFTPNKE